MAVDLQNVTAVQSGQTSGIIGHLMWYSVGKQLIQRDELERKLLGSGLDENWMPNPIRSSDAFRRATREVQARKATAQDGMFENFLVREVFSDKELIQRNIVVETVDQQGKWLDYNSQAAVITLDKKNKNVTVVAENKTAEELAQEAEQKFYLYRDHYSSQHLRVMISRILKSLAPTPVRPNGGVYFVPSAHTEDLEKLCGFASALENSEGFKVPLVNTIDNRQMVNQKMKEHFESILEDCQSTEEGQLKKGQVKEIIEEARRVISQYNDYKSLVTDDIEVMEAYIGKIRLQVARMVEAV